MTTRSTAVKAAGIAVVVASVALGAQQAPPAAAACTVSGTITGLGGPLPGVSITVRRDDTIQTAGSTDVDGRFRLSLPDASYQLTAELTGFDSTRKDVTVSQEMCAQTVDVTMTLTPRTASAPPRNGRGAGAAGPRGGTAPVANETAEAAAQRRFESLAVTENAATRSLDPSLFESGGDPSNVLAAGFGTEALADAFAVTGEAARVDRGLLNDRRDAINRGDFLPPDFDPRNFPGGFAGLEAALQGRGGGREGGNPNFQGRGGREGNPNGQGRGGGRAGNPNFRGGQRIQVTSTYGFSGSALNSAPRQLRSEVRGVEPTNANHNYNVSSQIPIKIPGIYNNPNNRTMLQFTYSG
ncbi:MAG TPA: carboxypeptidase-like regulatory domain-containing protein, partial [Vicinamibacterales bacterium]|nr:carboxypeptidase-like regulatory domain-containing protein [Vicinamibacterales bacterium]